MTRQYSVSCSRKGCHCDEEQSVCRLKSFRHRQGLYAVASAIRYDCRNNVEHVGDISEIHYEIVISIHVTTLRKPLLLSSGIFGFLYGILHILST